MSRFTYIISLILVWIIGVAAGYYVGYDHGWEKAPKNSATNQQTNNQTGTPNNTDNVFRKDANGNYLGKLTLTGYLDVQTRVCNPGDMCGETVRYASFIFTNSDNEAIKEFTGTMQGNSYIAGDRVGLGCQQADRSRIFYENFADSGYKSGEISGADYEKLVSSTRNNPVQITINRELYTSGQGASDCYSHFRDFDVI
ncbi:MAG TPA: hypothetical protein VEC17_02960 [Candidatus Binatia bacterium]|nr:hypothetical protein [Candidatus Binatia bacterium]